MTPESDPHQGDKLFSVTLYRDGTLVTSGGKDDRLSYVLRVIADALEDGQTKLTILDP